MFSSTDPGKTLLMARLNRIAFNLRNLSYSTKEDYQAEVYSEINGVLALGSSMQSVYSIVGEGPAMVGDVAENVYRLNQDAQDIASQIKAIEDDTAHLYNLAAASQNQLRQAIREAILACTGARYIEAFINSNNIDTSTTASIDFSSGVASLPIIKSTTLSPTITIGSGSIGSIDVDSSLSYLTDGLPNTALVWNGTTLELLLTFPITQVVNRLTMSLDNYDGVEITTLATSPDGTLYEDVLIDVNQSSILLNANTGKYSGDFILDFPPRHVSTIRIVIEDRVGIAKIAFRGMNLMQLSYSPVAMVVSNKITRPSGTVRFTSTELTWQPMVSITHQISYNGSTYTYINSGDLITIPGERFWYRAILNRNNTAFSTTLSAINSNTLDPLNNSNFSINNSTTIPLGNGTSQRIINFDSVLGPIPLREVPLPGTLQIQEGAIYLSPDQYNFSNQVLSFNVHKSNIKLTYQTTALGRDALADRQMYYTPLLYQVKFEKN